MLTTPQIPPTSRQFSSLTRHLRLCNSRILYNMKVAVIASFVIFVGVVSAQYDLPDGVSLYLGPITGGFDCTGRPYGYYADDVNFCQIFHVCLPILDDNNAVIDTAMYSFACGNQTVFDQRNLVCMHPQDAWPCEQAASLYSESNANFGVIPQK